MVGRGSASGGGHLWELLAEVAVDGVLHGEVVGAEAQVISACQRGLLLPQVHL